jgi:hypothetical protein
MGDVFFSETEAQLVPVFHAPNSYDNMRWWGGVSFLVAFIPLIILYAIWIPASLLGKIHEHKNGDAENGDTGPSVNVGMLSADRDFSPSVSEDSSHGKDKDPLSLDIERGDVISVTDALDSS